MRRNIESARQVADIHGGNFGDGGQSLEDMAGSRKKITTLENIQRRGIKLENIQGKNARPGNPNLASLRTRVMPTHEKFDSNLYLGFVHWVGGPAPAYMPASDRTSLMSHAQCILLSLSATASE